MFSNINIVAFNKLLNAFISKGKKERSVNLFLYLIHSIKKQKSDEISSLKFLHKSLNNIYPELYFKRLRKSRKIFYLPRIISDEQKIKIAMLWLKRSTENRKVQWKLKDRLLDQIIGAFNQEGETIKKKINLYSILLGNRPFLHIIRYSGSGYKPKNKYQFDKKKYKEKDKTKTKKSKIKVKKN